MSEQSQEVAELRAIIAKQEAQIASLRAEIADIMQTIKFSEYELEAHEQLQEWIHGEGEEEDE